MASVAGCQMESRSDFVTVNMVLCGLLPCSHRAPKLLVDRELQSGGVRLAACRSTLSRSDARGDTRPGYCLSSGNNCRNPSLKPANDRRRPIRRPSRPTTVIMPFRPCKTPSIADSSNLVMARQP